MEPLVLIQNRLGKNINQDIKKIKTRPYSEKKGVFSFKKFWEKNIFIEYEKTFEYFSGRKTSYFGNA